MRKVLPIKREPKWTTPTLAYRGTVGEILKSGGGKFSVTGEDHGEMRCEKPHVSQCT